MRFSIGEKVVCINNDGVEDLLEKGKEYIIDGLKKGCCSPVIVNVGVFVGKSKSGNAQCTSCKAIVSDDGYNWFFSHRFARIESIPESHEKEVEKLIEESIPVKI